MKNAAKAVYWSGLASTLGGLLWIALFLFVQLYMSIVVNMEFYASPFYDPLYYIASDVYNKINSNMVLVPMLLFLTALVGLYLCTRAQQQSYSRYGWLGLKLSFAGIILVIIGRLVLTWLSSATYVGIFNILWLPSEVLSWYYALMPGFLLLSTGLILYGIAAIKARILPTGGTLLLIVSSAMVHVFPLAVDMLFPRDEAQRIFDGGVFTLLLILFGMGWMWLGYVLWSKTPYMRPRPEEIRLGTHQQVLLPSRRRK